MLFTKSGFPIFSRTGRISRGKSWNEYTKCSIARVQQSGNAIAHSSEIIFGKAGPSYLRLPVAVRNEIAGQVGLLENLRHSRVIDVRGNGMRQVGHDIGADGEHRGVGVEG